MADGAWVKVRDHEFALTFAFRWFDQGQLFALGKARATVTLDGDEARGGVTFETLDTLDPGGTVLASGVRTLGATRLRADYVGAERAWSGAFPLRLRARPG